VNDSTEPGWVEVHRSGARAEAEQCALVLVAVGIDCQLVAAEHGFALRVAGPDAWRARRELARYAEENRRRPAPPGPPGRAFLDGIDGAFAYCALLLFLYGAPRRDAFSLDWWTAGVAHAGLIVNGEWWRTLTALGLHADLGHLASNLAFGSVLGLLLAQSLGVGLAWLAILLAGGLGNALAALVHSGDHTAIGASTAVFATLGMLAALSARHRILLGGSGLRRWAPLGAGAMLLAYLGFGGERTDIVGHVAGFLAGGALGAGLALGAGRLPRGRRAQWAGGAGALALFALAWILALRAHG